MGNAVFGGTIGLVQGHWHTTEQKGADLATCKCPISGMKVIGISKSSMELHQFTKSQRSCRHLSFTTLTSLANLSRLLLLGVSLHVPLHGTSSERKNHLTSQIGRPCIRSFPLNGPFVCGELLETNSQLMTECKSSVVQLSPGVYAALCMF